jgi:hypothetical protein
VKLWRTAFRSILVLSAVSASAQTVINNDVHNPRGLKFGPDGYLYVAEGGTGGAQSSAGLCPQVPAPVGPYTGGFNARISKINVATHARSTVVDHLPSSQTSVALGSLVSGVADVAFIGDTLYAVLAGAGCSHGLAGTANIVFRVNGDGSITPIADLSAFYKSHPVAHPEPDDFEPDGTWYSMISVRGALYTVNANGGDIERITPEGEITRLVDVSATQGHVVPTALAYHGNFFVGNLDLFPAQPNDAHVYKITPSGNVMVWRSNLEAVLGVAFDGRDRMYVLEMTTAPDGPVPMTGAVLRIDPDGSQHEIASKLFFPTGITIGPDGNLYVSNFGFGPPTGEIIRIDVPQD